MKLYWLRGFVCRYLMVASIAAVGIASASAATKVKWTVDSFNGTKTAKVDCGAFMSGAYGLPDTTFVELKLFGLAPSKQYFIRVEYSGINWLFIPDGNTFHVKVDDEMLTLSGAGSAGDRNTYDIDPYGSQKSENPIHVREVALYQITADQIRKIAAAKKIQYRLMGANRTITSGGYRPSEYQVFVDQAIPAIEGLSPSDATAATPTKGK